MAKYNDDVKVFRPSAAEPVLAGEQALSDDYARNRFNVPGLHVKLVNRI